MPKYIVCEGNSAWQLEQLVNERINIGYIPLGGVCVNTLTSSGVIYTQSLVYRD